MPACSGRAISDKNPAYEFGELNGYDSSLKKVYEYVIVL
jgi:hypothetical protein